LDSTSILLILHYASVPASVRLMVFAVLYTVTKSSVAVQARLPQDSFQLPHINQLLSVPRSLAMRLAVDFSMIALVAIPMVFV